MRMKGFMTLLAALFVLTMAAAAGGMYQGVSGGPAMSYGGVSGSIDGIFASSLFMTGEEFCQFVAAHLANPPTAWRW